MDFNSFQRELRKHGIDDHTAFMLTMVYEQVQEIGVRVNDCASVLLAMANTIKELTDLNEQTQKALRKVERGGRPDGIEVYSVRGDGDDK